MLKNDTVRTPVPTSRNLLPEGATISVAKGVEVVGSTYELLTGSASACTNGTDYKQSIVSYQKARPRVVCVV